MTDSNSDKPVRPLVTARQFNDARRWVYRGAILLTILIIGPIIFRMFVRYVPPGKILVVTRKNGAELPPGQMIAEAGQKGVQRAVLGEGWHFLTPVVTTAELRDLTVIPAGKVGIVTNLGGKKSAGGAENAILVDGPDEQGIRRQVLLPGAYRINPFGYNVESAPVTEIRPGYIGVVRRLLGKDNPHRFAEGATDKGLLRTILQPGLYFLNTKEYEVIPREIGIFQTSYSAAANVGKTKAKGDDSHVITFAARDGNTISLDATIEWDVLPADMPDIVAEFGTVEALEQNVIDQNARKISRDRGFNFGAQDFLDGSKRERFQTDFTSELKDACKRSHVNIRTAFIRNIVIPEDFLKLQRDRVIATETKTTSEAKRLTAASDAAVAEAKSMIDQAEANVLATTERKVASVDRDTQNVTSAADADIEALKAKYASQIATLDGERQKALGVAEADVKRLKETATAGLYKLQMEVFHQDGEAFLRYTLAEQLNPKLTMRLFQSGNGTLWTNMDGGKGLQFLLPQGQEAAKQGPEEAPKPRREVLPSPRKGGVTER